MIVPQEMAQTVLNWMAEHPYQTAFHVVNGVIMFTPAAATVPIFNMLGFSAAGPTAGLFSLLLYVLTIWRLTRSYLGSAASGIMGYFGFVPAGGLYATAQSAAMGGYGASIAAGAAQAGAAASSGAAWLFGRRG